MEAIRRVHDKQRANRWRLARSSAAERIERLKRLGKAIWDHRPALHRALHDDFRKNPAEADLTEIYPVLVEINHTVKHLKRWMKPVRVKTPLVLLGTSSEIRYEAKGLVLILAPWNYPVNLSMCPLVAAIAAGNCAVVKPSSKVEHTARVLGRLVAEVFPEEEVALFEGGSDLADELLAWRFDHVFFTGSPRVGKKVMRAAAEHLTPVTLELGGKSPAIVDATADVDKAAERILWGKFLNAGQTCVAPDYLLLHQSKREAFIQASRRVLGKRYGDTPELRRRSESYCRLVSKSHQQKLKKLLDESVARGATIVFGGDSDQDDRYLEPTLLADVDTGSPVMQEEIFGPILPILTFDDPGEPVRIIREMEQPLALYLFSGSREAAEEILRGTLSGGACVDSLILHLANPELPFGGVGNSGMGRYHGHHGFLNLSHQRAVLRQKRPDTLRFFYPPYTEGARKLIRLATRYLG